MVSFFFTLGDLGASLWHLGLHLGTLGVQFGVVFSTLGNLGGSFWEPRAPFGDPWGPFWCHFSILGRGPGPLRSLLVKRHEKGTTNHRNLEPKLEHFR